MAFLMTTFLVLHFKTAQIHWVTPFIRIERGAKRTARQSARVQWKEEVHTLNSADCRAIWSPVRMPLALAHLEIPLVMSRTQDERGCQ